MTKRQEDNELGRMCTCHRERDRKRKRERERERESRTAIDVHRDAKHWDELSANRCKCTARL